MTERVVVQTFIAACLAVIEEIAHRD